MLTNCVVAVASPTPCRTRHATRSSRSVRAHTSPRETNEQREPAIPVRGAGTMREIRSASGYVLIPYINRIHRTRSHTHDHRGLLIIRPSSLFSINGATRTPITLPGGPPARAPRPAGSSQKSAVPTEFGQWGLALPQWKHHRSGRYGIVTRQRSSLLLPFHKNFPPERITPKGPLYQGPRGPRSHKRRRASLFALEQMPLVTDTNLNVRMVDGANLTSTRPSAKPLLGGAPMFSSRPS